MGQTQLLLVILGMLLVGLAVYGGVTTFDAKTEEATRNAITHDLQNFAACALEYYTTPVCQGGGGRTFNNLTIRTVFPPVENANARYFIQGASQDSCVIAGVGKIVASNGDSVLIRIRVTPDRNFVEILN